LNNQSPPTDKSIAQASEEEEEEEEEQSYRVLIANDDPMQLYVLQIIFRMNNFEVVTA